MLPVGVAVLYSSIVGHLHHVHVEQPPSTIIINEIVLPELLQVLLLDIIMVVADVQTRTEH